MMAKKARKTTKTPRQPHKLPRSIYVVKRADDHYSYLEANEALNYFEDGDIIGVYELVTTQRKAVKHVLEPLDA